MPGSLEKISEDELAPGDVRRRRATVKKLAAMHNAWLNWKVIWTSGKDALTLTESNAVLELNPPGTAAAPTTAALNDFSLYDASDANGAKLGIANGTLGGTLPGGMTAGGSPPYVLPVSSAAVAYLVITVNNNQSSPTYGKPTSVTVGVGATMPADADPVFHLYLGDFTVSASAVTVGSGQQGIGSQGFLYVTGSAYAWAI